MPPVRRTGDRPDLRQAALQVLDAALGAAASLATLSERGRIVPELNDRAIREIDRPWATAFWTAVGYPRDDHIMRHIGMLDESVAIRCK